MQEKKQNISPIKQRILQFVDYLNISKREFYANTAISRGTLDNTTGITEETIAKLIAVYGEINSHWLLTGEGNMLKETSSVDKGEIKGKSPRDPCPFCQEKEKVIQSQGRHIETLSRQLDRCQDELDYHKDHARHRNDDGQKRKTG